MSMKIIQQLFIASCILTFQSTQTAWPMGLNNQAFDAYVNKTCAQLNKTNQDLQSDYADTLYAQQKAIFKDILKEIKDSAQHDPQAKNLYLQFKAEVYKSWKREFKKRYAAALTSNDIAAWAWIHEPVAIAIHE